MWLCVLNQLGTKISIDDMEYRRMNHMYSLKGVVKGKNWSIYTCLSGFLLSHGWMD